MRKAMWVVAVFGIIVIGGGIIGYIKAHSLVSLITGVLSGLVLLLSALGIMKGVYKAHYIALLASALLAVFFHYRYLSTGLFMPAGLMAILSTLAVLALLLMRPRRGR